jgi:hypothetical protein
MNLLGEYRISLTNFEALINLKLLFPRCVSTAKFLCFLHLYEEALP